MADTFIKIASVTVGSGGASSIDFTSIPSTYTDLCVKMSVRDTNPGTEGSVTLQFNGDTASNYKFILLFGTGSSAGSYSPGTTTTGAVAGFEPTSGYTSNIFSNNEFYIPNYAGSAYKSISADAAAENNATSARLGLYANLWQSTSAINRVTLSAGFAQYSTATLYGIKNS
jgi:hypothetical protein